MSFDSWYEKLLHTYEEPNSLLTNILGELAHLFEAAWEDGYSEGYRDGTRETANKYEEGKYY
jgi:hypothetical protein